MSTKKTYGDKLRDPRWQKLRLEVMNRDAFTCKLCQDSKSPLNIHHLKYVKEPWDCPPEFLITLCEDCHFIVTEQKIDLTGDVVEVRRLPRPNHTTFICLTKEGAMFYMKVHGQAVVNCGGVSHDVLKFVVHDILNYWLKTDQDHYLTEKLPVAYG